MRKRKGGDLYQRKTKPPAESKKRKIERKRYTEVCDLLTEEIKKQNDGHVYCFFSGLEIFDKRPHYHHLKSRTGDYYTDREWLVPSIDEYHLAWHDMSMEYLLKQKWYTDVFLLNLKKKSEQLYNKEIDRRKKAEPINPRLFDEDD